MWQNNLLIFVPLMAICLELLLPSLENAGRRVIVSLVVISFWTALRSHQQDWRRVTLASLTSLVGAVITFVLATRFQLGPMVASGLVGVVGGRLLPEDRQLQLYLGAFVGMSSAVRFPHFAHLVLAGALGGLLWELLEASWSGIGGRLGTLAASAVLIVLLLSGGGW